MSKITGCKFFQDHRVKAVLIGCLTALGVGIVLLLAVAFMMSLGKMPLWAVRGAGLTAGCIMSAVSGFVCAKVHGKNGFFLGMLSSGILFLSGLLCSLGIGEKLGFKTLVKLFAMLICGCVFGSIGVNLKKKQ